MVLVFGTVHTAKNLGVRLRRVCCERCGACYFYEMVRVGTGKGGSLYLLDEGGARDRASLSAKARLGQMLNAGVDPVPCPQCGHLQRAMSQFVRAGSPLPVPGMPPALVLVEGIDPSTGDSVQHLTTAQPIEIAPSKGWVSIQLPRFQLPDACCVCCGPADARYVPPLRLNSTEGALKPFVCRHCETGLRRVTWRWATIGWALAGALFLCLALLVPDVNSLGEVGFIGGGSLLLGLILMFLLPSVFAHTYSLVGVDPTRAIYQLRFRSEPYNQLIAATVSLSNNSGPVFSYESDEAAV
ncbi:MAG: hypothetical protein JWO31_745, partial [Phycisphaerales bacterium]|nr:hypothetical protein [Phycisphaerales bacterium]